MVIVDGTQMTKLCAQAWEVPRFTPGCPVTPRGAAGRVAGPPPLTRSTRSIVIRSFSTTYMIRYLPERSRNMSPHRKESAGYGSAAKASNAATTVLMPSASSRNRDAVVTALGDHSALTRRHQAAACVPARAGWRRAARPPTTPGTPPRRPRSQRPHAPAGTRAAPALAAAGIRPPEPQQRLLRQDESLRAGRCPRAQQAVRSCRPRYLPLPTSHGETPRTSIGGGCRVVILSGGQLR